MTIKEVEMLSGMERGNIRFYEREGLITPKRMDNGYRDYSQNDLQILLRIKLLRSLHISLEEIKALKEGSKDLLDTLSKQIVKLDQEKKDASYAQDVCRAMQGEWVTFADLDAKKYLNCIKESMKGTDSGYFSIKGDELPQVFHPWRRFLARIFDIFMYNTLWMALLALVFDVNLATRGNFENSLDSFISIAIMLFIEPFWLHMLGTTPGKALLGLRIENPDGRPLSYAEGLERTWSVIGTGMGYNIPIYNLICLLKSYKLCNEKETQPWDEEVSYTLKDTKWYRGVFYIGAHAVAIAFLLTVTSAQQLPPNRGNLTVAEFVENHNYYAEFFGINFGNKYLNKDGKWVKKDFDGRTHIEIQDTEKPKYHFTIANGYVKGVSFEIEITNNDKWLYSYDKQMFLVSLAFAGAQEEIGLFSKLPRRIGEEIEKNTFKDFCFEEAGITFTCVTDYSGYKVIQSHILIPEEKATKTYYSLSFSLIKQN
ncbi:MerR family transcriptional regulator [Alkaliphilus serpentinus]|uniref:MerR family transcriptional regulator n=1 Tax=Alkaliphilus serpentinus TaxID=1482731 RepID=A0A833HMT3_9FIRM|nr:MerR family transcriptional regulator [Alkaliphilus serpentinus]KAB3528839.1 MerR family transcriptional regulator [Alkaliphilus serpentinus]